MKPEAKSYLDRLEAWATTRPAKRRANNPDYWTLERRLEQSRKISATWTLERRRQYSRTMLNRQNKVQP